MFEVTYLGHHGWLVAGENGRLLVDPLLSPKMGFTDAVELRVHPPRMFDFAAFPSVDAVMLTHEHEGHFDLPSLNLIDRRIPVYLPERSSDAMRQVLLEMGFKIHLMRPGHEFHVGDLIVLPMTADHIHHGKLDEWDVMPYLVTDRAADGNFFSAVDVAMTESMWRGARARVTRPGLWTATNNSSQNGFQVSYAPVDEEATDRFVQRTASYYARVAAEWAKPEAILVVGGGFCFADEMAWLNQNAFTSDCARSVPALSAAQPDQRIVAPVPGNTFTMSKGRLTAVRPRSPFLQAAPETEWPPRDFVGDVPWLEDYTPACGRMELMPSEMLHLQAELTSFAAHLYGRAEFRALYSLTAENTGKRASTLALALRADGEGGGYVFEYRAQSCEFVATQSADPSEDYVAVFECWATDLLASFQARISPVALNFGRSRLWNAAGDIFVFDFINTLFTYTNPLRHPARYLTLYRRLAAALPAAEAIVRSPSPAERSLGPPAHEKFPHCVWK